MSHESQLSARWTIGGTLPAEYGGHCVRCAREHRFENDLPLAIASIEQLFAQLERDSTFSAVHSALQASRGKMIGVLVAASESGVRQVLRAYSGELAGRRDWPDWVGPVLRRQDTAALEAETLARIAALDAEIARCQVERAQQHLDETRAAVRSGAAERREAHQLQRRSWALARRAGADERELLALMETARRHRQEASEAEAARVEAALQALLSERTRLHDLCEARREASQVLSTAIFDVATVTNARGERWPLREVFAGARIAGGTTDCTVPKLLEAANVARLRPIALAEAWWGPSINGRRHGELQAPCDRKCKPILGHLLCGLEETRV